MEIPTVRTRVSTTPEERAEYVRLFEESGKSSAEFCRELGIGESTLALWRRQGREAPTPATFTEVPSNVVDAAMAANDRIERVTIEVTGMRVIAAVGADVRWLAALATALRG
jgi:transposase-like protein